jgi:hypothetical protein
LQKIWQCYLPSEYTFITTRDQKTGKWKDHSIRGNREQSIRNVLKQYPPDRYDIYYCPNPFSGPRRRAAFANGTRYSWSDIDKADPGAFRPRPSVLWETSEGSYQGLWVWKDAVPVPIAKQRSKNLWKLYGGDAGACSVTKILRVPGTINHKPGRDNAFVRLLHFDLTPRAIPKRIADLSKMAKETGNNATIDPLKCDLKTVRRKYRTKMGIVAGTLMDARRPAKSDRSGKVYGLGMRMMELGATDNEVACVLWNNPNFQSK